VKKADIKAINDLLESQAALGQKLGVNNIQQNRYMRDCSVGALVGVDKMNLDLHGWDGEFKNGIPFENKNVKASCKTGVSFSLKFQDTSLEKLGQLQTGVIATTTFWDNNGKPAFIMVGNTATVGDYLEESYNPASRRSSTVSMIRCLNRGFKLVAGSWSKEQILDTVGSKFIRLGQNLTPADIASQKELKSIVEEMM
jgi:hypothetical protein